jgi:metal-responsive CopG/Arc/MetJ family transcriptional regulator
MKTAISIPDELFDRADELARQSGKSRSQLYRDALTEYLRRHDPHAVTRALDEVVVELGGEPDAWLDEAARRTLERSEW